VVALNQLSLDTIRRRADLTGSALEERQPEDHEGLGGLTLDLAIYRLAAGDAPAALLPLFRTSSRHLARSLTSAPGAGPDPWAALDHLAVVSCFGNTEDRRTARRLDPALHCDAADPRHRAVGRVLGLLAGNIGGVRLDAAQLIQVAGDCEAANASRDEHLHLLPLIRGLLAVESKEPRGWNLALAQVTAAHAAEARWGDHRWRATGLIALTALMLLKRGLDARLACRVRSDYLPQALFASVVTT
jgi:hypothetical protein